MKKAILLLLPLLLSAYGYNPNEICKKIERGMAEAKMIDQTFHDADNALLLMQQNGTSLFYRKPECMKEKTYMDYFDQYALLQTRATKRPDPRSLEQLIKKYPQHLLFYKAAGKVYEKNYHRYKNQKAKEKALTYYKQYIALSKKQGVTPDAAIVDYVKTGGLRRAKTTWGKYLNPQGEAPLGRFKAFYISTEAPKKIIASEEVDTISVNYPYKEFHGIDSYHFGGYWVGKLAFGQKTQKVFYLAQSNSTTRIIVDGYVLYDGRGNAEIPYTFTKGTHTIEVEFLNKWHTTQLSVKLFDKIKKLDTQALKKSLQPLVTAQTRFYYAGVYESRRKDQSITLTIEKIDAPIILLLQSYDAVTWVVNNPYKVPIKAIILHSTHPQAEVKGALGGAKIFYASHRLTVGNGYRFGLPKNRSTKGCMCVSGHFTCQKVAAFDASYVPAMFNKKVYGFSGKYGTDALKVPEILINSKAYDEIKAWNAKIEALRQKCVQNRSLTPDELFH